MSGRSLIFMVSSVYTASSRVMLSCPDPQPVPDFKHFGSSLSQPSAELMGWRWVNGPRGESYPKVRVADTRQSRLELVQPGRVLVQHSNFHVFPCGSCGNSYSWKPCAPLKIKQPHRFSVLGAFKVQDEKGTWEIQKMGQKRGYFD